MASLALSASQRALDVTGQNLSNIHTLGYTRQRLDQVSLNPVGNSISSSAYDAKVGQGVMMTGVSQIRDPFLDIQYRNQLPKVGTASAEDAILSQIGQIFDETDKEAIAYQFQQIITQLQNLADPQNTGTNSADSVVRSACEILLNTIHQNGTKIQEVYDELMTKMDETVIPEINGYLRDIAELDKSIRNSQVLGNPALELQDERNELIDALSTYFPIEASYEKKNMGGGIYVDILNINLKLSDGRKINLVHDDEYGEVGITKDADGKIVEPVDLFIKESGENGKTYGGGVDNLEKALPAELNSFVSDIVNLNNDIKKYIDKIADVDAKIADQEGVINGYLQDVADLNNQIALEKQNANPDVAKIRSLERKRANTMDKLGEYFPKNCLQATTDKATGIMSVTAKTGTNTSLNLISTDAGGISQAGSVSLSTAADNRIMMAVTSTADGTGATETADIRSGFALYDLEKQRMDLTNGLNKAIAEREEKVKGLEGYFPAGTIDTPVIDPVTGYMSITANGQTLIDANNVASEITTVVNRDADGKLTPPVTAQVGGVNIGDIPQDEVDRMLETMIESISEGIVKGDLNMLNKAEIFDKNAALNTDATDTKGIQYYQKMLDAFVDQFAKTMNELNKTAVEKPVKGLVFDAAGNPVMDPATGKQQEVDLFDIVYETQQVEKKDADGNVIKDVNGNPVMETVYVYETQEVPDGNGGTKTETVMVDKQEQKKDKDGNLMYDANGDPMMETVIGDDGNPVQVPKLKPVMENGVVKKEQRTEIVAGEKENPLFSTTDGSDTFTAANIKISDGWMNGDIHVQTKNDIISEGNSSDNWNVDRMIDALSTTVFNFTTPDGDKVFSGTLYECYTNIQGVQSVERKATSQILNTHTTVMNQIADEKDSVSGVWMDEEVMGLMKYTQAYNAASRLMTTMDEILERLITQTGVCGR
jgi:flagellar hook-associated protein FlgK